MKVLEGSNEHFLRDVRGLFHLRHHPPHKAKHPILIRIDELPKCLGVLSATTINQGSFGGWIDHSRYAQTRGSNAEFHLLTSSQDDAAIERFTQLGP